MEVIYDWDESFDIMNNNFRLITEIYYKEQEVFILEFLIHAQ